MLLGLLTNPYSIATLVVIVTVLAVIRKGAAGGVFTEAHDLTGKYIIVTGGNTGLGLATAKLLAKMGKPTIIIACRDTKRAADAVKDIQLSSGNVNVESMQLDLGDLASIRQFAKDYEAKKYPLNILINNAGIAGGKQGDKTKDGFERIFGTNHLGPFLLTNLLLPVMKKTPQGRIVMLSSVMLFHGYMYWEDLQLEKKFDENFAYSQSKLANAIFAYDLNKRLKAEGSDLIVNYVHPGYINTSLQTNISPVIRVPFRLIVGLLGKTEIEGAQTTLYAALSRELAGNGGNYLVDCAIAKTSKDVNDDNAKKLWDISAKLVNL